MGTTRHSSTFQSHLNSQLNLVEEQSASSNLMLPRPLQLLPRIRGARGRCRPSFGACFGMY